jgi:hypothetical protein
MNNSENNSEDLSDYSSDEETFIDINELLKDQTKKIYQIQLNNDKLMIKHIGMGSHVPDIIIKETFGKKNNLSLYNCVYSEDEINFLKIEQNSEKLLPVVKLIEKIDEQPNIYSISVKINNFIDYDEYTSKFDIYLTYNTNNELFHHVELNKNINHTNIIETMLEKIIDIGFDIL